MFSCDFLSKNDLLDYQSSVLDMDALFPVRKDLLVAGLPFPLPGTVPPYYGHQDGSSHHATDHTHYDHIVRHWAKQKK